MRLRVAAFACASMLVGVVPAAIAADPVPEGTIAADVSIDGVPVGGFPVDAARRAVIDARIAPRVAVLVVGLKGRRMGIKPSAAGWSADLDGSIATALTYGRAVPLVADAMLTRAVPFVDLPVKRVRPAKLTVGASVVVDRANRVLTLYREAQRVRTFRIAVGTSQHPTPRGLFSIVQKQRNHTWVPPDSPWAKGLGPIPPGSGNPLGTRWMGTSASAVGIHGTPAPGSIGTAASHGCIRMYIRDAEWLYERVTIGTPVLIR